MASEAISLKYGHDAPTRRQSPEWETLSQTYLEAGFNITSMKDRYCEAYEQFIQGGKRNSKKKGYYSSALRAATDLFQAAELEIWRSMASQLNTLFDRNACAAGTLRDPVVFHG